MLCMFLYIGSCHIYVALLKPFRISLFFKAPSFDILDDVDFLKKQILSGRRDPGIRFRKLYDPDGKPCVCQQRVLRQCLSHQYLPQEEQFHKLVCC